MNQVYNLNHLVKNSKDILVVPGGKAAFTASDKQTLTIPGFGDALLTLERILKVLGTNSTEFDNLLFCAFETVVEYTAAHIEKKDVDIERSTFLLILYIWNDNRYKITKEGEIIFVSSLHGVTIHSGYIMTEDFKNIIYYYLENEKVD